MSSPCIDVCRHDEETGWCLGCGMSRRDRKQWKKEKGLRAGILAELPFRLAALRQAGLTTGKAAKRKKAK
jgi:hypothetical protein